MIMMGIKAKGTKNCALKRNLKFEDYKYCLEATQVEKKTKKKTTTTKN